MNTVGIEHCIGVMAKCGLEEHITAHPSRLWFAMANVMPQDSTCAGSSDADRSIDYHMSACAHLAICSSVWRGPPRAANMGPNAHTHAHCATTKYHQLFCKIFRPRRDTDANNNNKHACTTMRKSHTSIDDRMITVPVVIARSGHLRDAAGSQAAHAPRQRGTFCGVAHQCVELIGNPITPTAQSDSSVLLPLVGKQKWWRWETP
jgi:hypothetical protein